jgi:hypothetical protein
MAAGPVEMGGTRPRRPGWVLAIIGVLAVVAAGTFYVLSRYEAAAPKHLIHPAYAPGALPTTGVVTPGNAVRRLLAFLPEGAYFTIAQALRQADGYRAGARLPATFTVRRDGARWLVTVRLPVDVRYLEQVGEISVGAVPGASDLRSGNLAVSTNEAIYGVDMNPRTHVAVYRFLLGRRGGAVWALNWNALGIISQSDSLQ